MWCFWCLSAFFFFSSPLWTFWIKVSILSVSRPSLQVSQAHERKSVFSTPDYTAVCLVWPLWADDESFPLKCTFLLCTVATETLQLICASQLFRGFLQLSTCDTPSDYFKAVQGGINDSTHFITFLNLFHNSSHHSINVNCNYSMLHPARLQL